MITGQEMFLDLIMIFALVFTVGTIVNHVEESVRLDKQQKAELDRLRRLAQLYDRNKQ